MKYTDKQEHGTGELIFGKNSSKFTFIKLYINTRVKMSLFLKLTLIWGLKKNKITKENS